MSTAPPGSISSMNATSLTPPNWASIVNATPGIPSLPPALAHPGHHQQQHQNNPTNPTMQPPVAFVNPNTLSGFVSNPNPNLGPQFQNGNNNPSPMTMNTEYSHLPPPNYAYPYPNRPNGNPVYNNPQQQQQQQNACSNPTIPCNPNLNNNSGNGNNCGGNNNISNGGTNKSGKSANSGNNNNVAASSMDSIGKSSKTQYFMLLLVAVILIGVIVCGIFWYKKQGSLFKGKIPFLRSSSSSKTPDESAKDKSSAAPPVCLPKSGPRRTEWNGAASTASATASAADKDVVIDIESSPQYQQLLSTLT